MTRTQTFVARLLDLLAAACGLALLAVPMLVIAVAVAATSAGPALFRQVRIGRNGQPFQIVKFRTMTSSGERGSSITVMGDARVTPFGTWLRRWKLDELPQLFNVLVGDMSLVGPRPDVPGYADRLEGEERRVLDLRPGMTGRASLLFRDEEKILAAASDPLSFNDQVIFREKVRVNLEAAAAWSVRTYLGYVLVSMAPGLSERAGVTRRLGLDIPQFTGRMIERALAFSASSHRGEAGAGGEG